MNVRMDSDNINRTNDEHNINIMILSLVQKVHCRYAKIGARKTCVFEIFYCIQESKIKIYYLLYIDVNICFVKEFETVNWNI